ncbi:response regulator transcription factor [Chryseobacterium potabilaquae]|uniref:Oxygen regulatory protein NreC n=1 Tax=Chryseobacterium potabilaquae TaxID=2675057 RepID=A0A6N4X3Q2_9FLAO|nr:response regulator transcription factor [Chryseobacterium potabilaquae]CAA7194058.1 Oxygen regulatory protein NreC [Chryseobacterium potabilaquae]
MSKKILIADDHHVVRVGTALVLNKTFPDYSIEYAINYPEVKEKLKIDRFDLIFLDIDMPGSIRKGMVKELKTIQEDVLIIIFSNYKEHIAIQYIHEGADGFLNKLSDEESLVDAVNNVFKDGFYYSRQIIKKMRNNSENNDPRTILSKREYEVFELLAKGNGNLEIASILNLEPPTVGTYKKRIYEKLDVENTIEIFLIYNDLH